MKEQRRKKVGLALGGGVARGLAHIGVLSVLEKAGIPIDYVAGTSAGSLIGVTYCAGMDVEAIKAIALRMHWWRLARPVWPSRGFVSFDPLARWLVRELGDLHFSQLQTPYAAIATDLDTGESVTLCEGRVAPAVQASCSVPGFVVPVELNGRLLGDGSLANTVPVSTLRAMGADFVIGVDIFSAAIRKRLGPFGMGVNAIEILVQRAGGGIDDADLLIRPRLGGASYLRFSLREKYFKLGEEAALAKLDELRAIL
jgi:NTE family protein